MDTFTAAHLKGLAVSRNPWKALENALPAGTDIKDMYGFNDPGLVESAAADLVNDNSVEVIVAAGGPGPALVLQAKTKTKSIVFTTVADPVLSKLVDSLQKPGHNLTGMAGKTSELDADRLVALFQLAQAKLQKNDKVGVLLKYGRDHADAHYKKLKDKAAEVDAQFEARACISVYSCRHQTSF